MDHLQRAWHPSQRPNAGQRSNVCDIPCGLIESLQGRGSKGGGGQGVSHCGGLRPEQSLYTLGVAHGSSLRAQKQQPRRCEHLRKFNTDVKATFPLLQHIHILKSLHDQFSQVSMPLDETLVQDHDFRARQSLSKRNMANVTGRSLIPGISTRDIVRVPEGVSARSAQARDTSCNTSRQRRIWFRDWTRNEERSATPYAFSSSSSSHPRPLCSTVGTSSRPNGSGGRIYSNGVGGPRS
ncbi:hypothetical protein OBBRIDRAFT_807541 [Obba rivulosa]|uniref:Uncharacterized protein n=1 Tax=Obba rivulosa TaxID=1052685 RepID=A0A8E2ARL5_9APHY|nr:hypothetical protein OBBRIDRAFT_807541 [Obba rivulosa]